MSCPPASVHVSSENPTPTNTVSSSSDYSNLYTSSVQPGPSSPSPHHSANATFPPHPRLQISFPTSAHFVSFRSALSPPPHVPGCFSIPPASSSPSDALMILLWDAGGTLYLVSPVNIVCIQESNLYSSSFFWVSVFSALRSDCTQPWSGIFSPMTRTFAVALSFSSGRAFPSLNFLPLLFLRLIPTLFM